MLQSRLRLLWSTINRIEAPRRRGNGCTSSHYAWSRSSFGSYSTSSSMGANSIGGNGATTLSGEDNHHDDGTSYSSLGPFLTSAAAASASSYTRDVTPLAESMRAEVREYTKRQKDAIRLVGIVATTTTTTATSPRSIVDIGDEEQRRGDNNNSGEENPALVYSQQIAETFAQDGIEYEMHSCIAKQALDVEAVIREMNDRDDVHGILVFYPIFKNTPLAAAVTAAKPASRRRHANNGTNEPEEEENSTSPRYYLNRLTGVRYKTADDYLRDLVCPTKDVEGLRQNHNSNNDNNNINNASNGRLFRTRGGLHDGVPQDVYVPCTAQAVTKILAMYHHATHHHQQQPQSSLTPGPYSISPVVEKSKRWLGCTATVINRSEICGLPLAALLALEGATVYSVDESSILEFVQQQDDELSASPRAGGVKSNDAAGGTARSKMRRSIKTLNECLMESTIIVTGVPSPDFALPPHVIQKGTTVINISGYPNIDAEVLLQRPGIQFIPQIGKVTVAALEQNLIRLHQQQQRQRECQQEQQQ